MVGSFRLYLSIHIEIGKIGLIAAIVTMLALVIHNIIVRAVNKEAVFSK